MTLVYDPESAPDPDTWLASTEEARLEAAVAHHAQGGEIHPAIQRENLHAAVHVVVENQLAAGAPRCVQETMERLMAAGASRHGAIHAIGRVAVGYVVQLLGPAGAGYTPAGYAEDLAHLSIEHARMS